MWFGIYFEAKSLQSSFSPKGNTTEALIAGVLLQPAGCCQGEYRWSSSPSPSSSSKRKSAERTDWALLGLTTSDTTIVLKVRTVTRKCLLEFGESKCGWHLFRVHSKPSHYLRDNAQSDESREEGTGRSCFWRGSRGREKEVVIW